MAISIELGDPTVFDFTLDESEFRQNATDTAGVSGDDDDEDISRAALQGVSSAFDTLVYTTLGFDTGFSPNGRIALSPTDLYTVTSDGTLTEISLAGEYDPVSMTAAALPVYDGSNFAAGGESGLTTTDGEEIRLFSDVDLGSGPEADAAGLGGNVLIGVDSSGDFVLAILMVETVVGSSEVDLQFAMVTNEAVFHNDLTSADEPVNLNDFISITAAETSGFDFAGVPPGKSLVLTAAALSGEGGVIVTPLTEVVQINTSNAFPDGVIGYGSQGINAGETVAVTWVKDGLVEDFTIPNLDQNEADLESSIRFGSLDSVDEATFRIQQKVGSATAAVKITALDTNTEDGTTSANFFDYIGNAATVGGAGDDVIVAIDEVTLTRGGVSYTLSADGSFGATGVTADLVDADGGGNFAGQVIITGVLAGDAITYHSVADHERLLVTGVSGNVDIGGFQNTRTGAFATPAGDAFVIEDAAPTVDVVADVDAGELAALARNLDETIDPDKDQINDGADTYKAGDTPDDNGDLDDVPDTDGAARKPPIWSAAPLGSQAIGSLESEAGRLSALFADATTFVNFDTDGPDSTFGTAGRTDAVAFSLSGSEPVETNLVATAVGGLAGLAEASRKIYLVQVDSTTIEGRVPGPDGSLGVGGDDYVIVRLTLTNPNDPLNSTIVYQNFAPVENLDPNLSDEAVSLLIPAAVGETLSVQWTTTAKDGDHDQASDTESVVLIDDANTILEIDDDGPVTTGETELLELWEDGLLPNGISDNDGEAEVTTASGTIADQIAGGTDGIREFGWTSSAAFIVYLEGLGLTAGGDALSFAVTEDAFDNDGDGLNDDQLLATVDGTDIFEVILEKDGGVEANLFNAFDHPQALPGQPDEDVISVNLSQGLVGTENDGDLAVFLPDALVVTFEDDAAEIDPDIADTPVLAFDSTSTFTDTGFLGYGADGPGSFVITDFTVTPTSDDILGTISGSLSNNDTVLTYSSSEYGDFLRITLDGTEPGGYTAQVLQDAPIIRVPLIDGATTPGGPVEEFRLPEDDPFATFDGFLFQDPFNGSLRDKFQAGDSEAPVNSGDSLEDVNISNRGAALEDNQFDFGEGLAIFFDEPIAGLEYIIRGGTGGGTTFDLYAEAYLGDELVGFEFYDDLVLPKGNNELTLEFLTDGPADQIYFVHDLQPPNGFRIPEIFAFQFADITDLQGTVTVDATDRDFDMDQDTFAWMIDGNGDGLIA